MYILVVGLNHKTAPVAVREKFAFSPSGKETFYASFREEAAMESAAVLSTCNRTELYAVARDKEKGKQELYALLERHTGQKMENIRPFLYEKECEEAVLHLYRVSAGLDSQILGETQILGQLKQAYTEARAHQASGRVMNQLMQKAFAVGKKVRTATAIDQHPVSVSYVAVEQAKKQLGSLANKQVLVVGAGEAGQLIARYLKEEGVQAIFISNRSAETAEKLAQDLNGTAVRFDALTQYLAAVDLVISCTGASHFVIHGEECRNALINRQGKPLLFIDIAVPRDVDPAFSEIPGVSLFDMDTLETEIFSQQAQRKEAAQQGEAIIQEEIDAFRSWSASLHLAPVIAALKKKGEAIRTQEVQRAINRLGESSVGEREKRILSEMAQAIVNQLLRQPVETLKAMAEAGHGEEYAAGAKRLFGLELPEKTEKESEFFE